MRAAAAMLKRAVESKGIEVHLNAETARIVGKQHAEGVVLKDGTLIEADLDRRRGRYRAQCRPARRPPASTINRGIVVDDVLQTSRAGIYAIGECAEHRGICYGLVEPAYEQAAVLARASRGREGALSTAASSSTNLKVSGVNVFSAGDFLGAPGTEQIVLSDPGIGIYKKLVIAEGPAGRRGAVRRYRPTGSGISI